MINENNGDRSDKNGSADFAPFRIRNRIAPDPKATAKNNNQASGFSPVWPGGGVNPNNSGFLPAWDSRNGSGGDADGFSPAWDLRTSKTSGNNGFGGSQAERRQQLPNRPVIAPGHFQSSPFARVGANSCTPAKDPAEAVSHLSFAAANTLERETLFRTANGSEKSLRGDTHSGEKQSGGVLVSRPPDLEEYYGGSQWFGDTVPYSKYPCPPGWETYEEWSFNKNCRGSSVSSQNRGCVVGADVASSPLCEVRGYEQSRQDINRRVLDFVDDSTMSSGRRRTSPTEKVSLCRSTSSMLLSFCSRLLQLFAIVFLAIVVITAWKESIERTSGGGGVNPGGSKTDDICESGLKETAVNVAHDAWNGLLRLKEGLVRLKDEVKSHGVQSGFDHLKTELSGGGESSDERVREAFQRLRLQLKSNVIGQDVDTIYDGLWSWVSKLSHDKPDDRFRVVHYFGDTGTGKTFVASLLLDALQHLPTSQYSLRHVVVPYELSATVLNAQQTEEFLNSRLSRRRRTILVLDGVESASSDVRRGIASFVSATKRRSMCSEGGRRALIVVVSSRGTEPLFNAYYEKSRPVSKSRKLMFDEIRTEIESQLSAASTSDASSKLRDKYADLDVFDVGRHSTHVVPFLPLEKNEVLFCIEQILKRKGIPFDDDKRRRVFRSLYPHVTNDNQAVPKGCKNLSARVLSIVYGTGFEMNAAGDHTGEKRNHVDETIVILPEIQDVLREDL